MSAQAPRRARRGPLAGVQVVDASRILAGPYCGAILADLGADVLRIEHPSVQDEVHTWTPKAAGISAPYAAVNHSKRGLALDIAHADGIPVFRRLLQSTDVLIENFRPGTLERIGFDRAALRALNPRLIHCAVRAFPAGTGSESLPGYEASMQAYSGIMSVTGEPDGDPVRCGISAVDLGTGMAAVIAILSALRERDRTGEFQYVEPALLRTASNLLNYQIAGYTMAGNLPQRHGSGHELLVPYRSFECADGPLLIAASNDRLWARLVEVLGLAPPGEPMPYPSRDERVANRAAVNALVAEAVSRRARKALIDALAAAGIPCAPVNTVAEFTADESLRSAAVLLPLALPGTEGALLPGALFAAEFLDPDRAPPPGRGEHTESALRELGYADTDIAALRARGAIL